MEGTLMCEEHGFWGSESVPECPTCRAKYETPQNTAEWEAAVTEMRQDLVGE